MQFGSNSHHYHCICRTVSDYMDNDYYVHYTGEHFLQNGQTPVIIILLYRCVLFVIVEMKD